VRIALQQIVCGSAHKLPEFQSKKATVRCPNAFLRSAYVSKTYACRVQSGTINGLNFKHVDVWYCNLYRTYLDDISGLHVNSGGRCGDTLESVEADLV
jgi:hypothetical protein